MPTPTYLALQAIQQGPGVRAKLEEVAGRINARLVTITARDRLSKETDIVTRTNGTRPKGRSYSQVGLTNRTRAQAQAEIAEANNLSVAGGGTVSVAQQAISGATNVNP